MKREIISSPQAPAAIGPYSQGVGFGDLLLLSGQIALDPKTGEMKGESAAEQAEQVMQNLGAVLQAGGSSFEGLLKCCIYLLDMDDFAEVNAVYARFMPDPPPARVTVAVAQLPKGARVEIDAIAYKRG